jgi:hypothetical protein
MANEFIARNGFIAQNNSTINGTLLVSGSITGTASFAISASQAQTASYVVSSSFAISASQAQTASYVVSSSFALSSSQAQTASYVLNTVSASYALSSSQAQTASYVITAQTASYVVTAQTASYVLSASYALSSSQAQTASYVLNAVSASYALNGGVTQLLAGPNVTLSPTNGLGQVTISSTSGGGGFNTATGSYGSFYDTTTQTNPVANIYRSMSLNTTDITNGVFISGSTNPFNTYIKTQNAGVYNIQFSAQVDKTDGGTDDIVIWLRKNGIDLTDTATTLTLPTNNSKVVAAWNWFVNSAANDYYQIIWYSADTDLRLLAEPAGGGHPGIPSLIVTANRVDQFLSNTGSFSGSFTGSLSGTASFATSASFINTLNQNVIISGSAAIGTGSLGASENTLTLGARDTASEGGQLGLNAPGGTYLSASMFDNYQNRTRLLTGTNTTSVAEVAWWNMHTKQMALPAYQASSSFGGTATADLAVDSGGNIITIPHLYRTTNLTDTTTISGSTLQLLYSQLIPANTFIDGDIVRVSWRGQKLSAVGPNTASLYINTASSLSGATLLGIYTSTVNVRMIQMDRKLYVKNATTNTEMYSIAQPSAGEWTANPTSLFTTSSINWAINQYIIAANQLQSGSDSFKGSSIEVERIRTT